MLYKCCILLLLLLYTDKNKQQFADKTSAITTADEYQIVTSISLKVKDTKVPFKHVGIKDMNNEHAYECEVDWFVRLMQLIDKEHLESNDFYIALAAFHASKMSKITKPPAFEHLLPLFYENAHSPAMMLHAMHVVRKVV